MQGFYVKKSFIIIFLFIIFHSALLAKSADKLYKEGRFSEAEKEYQKMDMDNPKDIRFRYNRGCAAFRNSDYKSAGAAFSSVLKRTKNKDILYRSAYNLGNTAFSQNDFASAAEFYKQAIIYNPEGSGARYNLELALRKLEEEKRNQDKGDQKNKKDDNKQNGDNKSQDKPDKNDRSGDKDKKSDNKNDMNKQQDTSDIYPADKYPTGNADRADKDRKHKPEASPGRQKAEALLDNLNEDRAKILRFQIPEGGEKTGSGKDW